MIENKVIKRSIQRETHLKGEDILPDPTTRK